LKEKKFDQYKLIWTTFNFDQEFLRSLSMYYNFELWKQNWPLWTIEKSLETEIFSTTCLWNRPLLFPGLCLKTLYLQLKKGTVSGKTLFLLPPKLFPSILHFFSSQGKKCNCALKYCKSRKDKCLPFLSRNVKVAMHGTPSCCTGTFVYPLKKWGVLYAHSKLL